MSRIQSTAATPYQIRTLVLDYLCHHCYTNTARAFARESTVRQLDADGDELMLQPTERSGAFVELSETVLDQLLRREKIRNLIHSGRVDDAIDDLNRHFPKVLSMTVSSPDEPTASPGFEYISSKSVEPDHILLNLRILAFIEACRTKPLEFSPSPQPEMEPAPVSAPTSKKRTSGCLDHDDPDCLEQQTALLKSAQKLYALVSVIQNPAHRATYEKELNNVSGLLAYKIPEDSPVAKYLSQERRDAVAEQVNAAILYRLGLPTMPYVELYTRYTSSVWSLLHDFRVKPPPEAVVPPTDNTKPAPKPASATDKDSKDAAEGAPPFDFRLFLDSRA